MLASCICLAYLRHDLVLPGQPVRELRSGIHGVFVRWDVSGRSRRAVVRFAAGELSMLRSELETVA